MNTTLDRRDRATIAAARIPLLEIARRHAPPSDNPLRYAALRSAIHLDCLLKAADRNRFA